MDVTAAALGDLYVTAKDAKSSLTLGMSLIPLSLT